MDSGYLVSKLGVCLKQALSEVVEKRPNDPIEYLAQFLYKFHKTEVLKEEVSRFEIYLIF